MRMIYIFLLSTTVLLLSFGCTGVKKTTDQSTYSTANGMQIQTKAGEEFFIEVNSVPSSGFKWMLVEPIDESLISFVERRYDETEVPKEPQGFMVNNSVDEKMVFKALKSGSTELQIKYVQPFNPDDPEAEIQTYQVVIE